MIAEVANRVAGMNGGMTSKVATRKVTTSKRKTLKRTSKRADYLHAKCYAAVGMGALASAALNIHTIAEHSSAGWAVGLGLGIPTFVLLLGQIAGGAYQRGHMRLAGMVGSIATALLLLSVVDCYQALAAITGMPAVACALLAVVVDCGMVASEVVAVTTKR